MADVVDLRSDGDDLSDDTVARATDELVRRRLAAPERARNEAQLGGGVATTAAIGILLAGGGLGLLDEPWWVVLLAGASFVAWLVAVAYFIKAFMTRPKVVSARRLRATVAAHLDEAEREASTVRKHASRALVPMVAGVILTGATTVGAAEDETISEYIMRLETAGRTALERICDADVPSSVVVLAEDDNLKADPARFALKEPSCGEISLAQRHISAVRLVPAG